MSAVHFLIWPQLEPGCSAVIWPLLTSMMDGTQLQRGSLNRFQPMMVGSSYTQVKSVLVRHVKQMSVKTSIEPAYGARWVLMGTATDIRPPEVITATAVSTYTQHMSGYNYTYA